MNETVHQFIQDVTDQTPEKPDHWSACGQCERNSERARDLLETELLQSTGFNDDQIVAAARVLCNRSADAMNVNREDNWAIYGADYLADAKAMLEAALQSKDAVK